MALVYVVMRTHIADDEEVLRLWRQGRRALEDGKSRAVVDQGALRRLITEQQEEIARLERDVARAERRRAELLNRNSPSSPRSDQSRQRKQTETSLADVNYFVAEDVGW